MADKVCEMDGVSMGELISGSRRREIVNDRGSIFLISKEPKKRYILSVMHTLHERSLS